jgi:hypothetical protein
VSLRFLPVAPLLGAVAGITMTLALLPAAASAQARYEPNTPRRGSAEVSGGLIWSGAMDFGTRTADETRNINTGNGAFTLFSTASRVPAVAGGQAHLGVYLSRAFEIEGGVQYLRPKLSTRISGDTEQAPDITVTETMARYVVDGSLLVHLTGLSFAGGKGMPFLIGGGGYIRELHTGNELIETGSEYHAGAGVKLWFSDRPRRLGIRADVGASIRDQGIDFGTGRRTVPTAGVSLTYLF